MEKRTLHVGVILVASLAVSREIRAEEASPGIGDCMLFPKPFCDDTMAFELGTQRRPEFEQRRGAHALSRTSSVGARRSVVLRTVSRARSDSADELTQLSPSSTAAHGKRGA